MYLFTLPLSEEHERTLSFLQTSKAEVLSSAGPVGVLTAKEIYEDRNGAIEEASVCCALVQGQWPKTSDEFCQALCDEPKSVLDWRRRNFLMMAVAKNMVFVADDKVASSQELLTLLTVARIVGAQTLGVIPAGTIPFAVPSTILSAADLILSGEADSHTAQRIIRSLTQEG